MKARIYPPVGSCIYCGSTDAPLSREHILAYGLGGNLVLRDASCKECATKTSRFEETVLRQMFGPYRVRIDMPSRHRKRRPKELLFEVVKKDGNVAIISVDPKEHPGSIVFPVFPEPGVLVCREDNAGFQMGLCASTDFPRVKTLAETHGGRGFSLGVADFNSMARLLAKTAHAYCFAEFGDFRAAYQPSPSISSGTRVIYGFMAYRQEPESLSLTLAGRETEADTARRWRRDPQPAMARRRPRSSTSGAPRDRYRHLPR